MNNWLISETHSEPSNEELGIKPWVKPGWQAIGLWVVVGLGMWTGIAYLIFG